MQPSDAIEFLAKIKRSEHNDIFEALLVLAKAIVHEGVQFDINGEYEVEDANAR